MGGRGIAMGHTLPKSGQVNFLWGNNNVRMVIEHFIPPQKTYIPPRPQNKFLTTPLMGGSGGGPLSEVCVINH